MLARWHSTVNPVLAIKPTAQAVSAEMDSRGLRLRANGAHQMVGLHGKEPLCADPIGLVMIHEALSCHLVGDTIEQAQGPRHGIVKKRLTSAVAYDRYMNSLRIRCEAMSSRLTEMMMMIMTAAVSW